MVEKRYNFIYKTTCTETNKFYIGMHSTDNLNDGYVGSGKILQLSLKKYGLSKHKFKILKNYKTRYDLIIAEKELITEELLIDPLCLNLSLGDDGGDRGEHINMKISNSVKKYFLDINNKNN